MALWNEEHKILVGTQAKCASTALNQHLPRYAEFEFYFPMQPPPSPSDYPLAVHRVMQSRDPSRRFRSVWRYMYKKQYGETLGKYVNDINEFVLQAFGGKYDNQFTRTQSYYADAMSITHFCKLEEGGIVEWLNREFGMEVPELPHRKVTGGAEHAPEPPLSELRGEALDLLHTWINVDAKRFGYPVCDLAQVSSTPCS